MGEPFDPWRLRLELLARENAARAKALDADRAGEDAAAAHWRAEARRVLADRLALPDPTAAELGRRLDQLADAFTLAGQGEQRATAGGDAGQAAAWRRDMDDALAHTWQLRRAAAEVVLKGVRWAAELDPAALAAALALAPPPAEVVRLRAEVAELRGAVVGLAERLGVAR